MTNAEWVLENIKNTYAHKDSNGNNGLRVEMKDGSFLEIGMDGDELGVFLVENDG